MFIPFECVNFNLHTVFKFIESSSNKREFLDNEMLRSKNQVKIESLTELPEFWQWQQVPSTVD